ncbi:MAG: helix-turn-helix domain-containing protein [Proteobacteria bacterium]|nr:helix-turn-helix domain-containing protein [Pseudomonadota bacterium]MBU1742725.1 helix-turn-helix domain-containing protein [Pseudomonadota bacterium]
MTLDSRYYSPQQVADLLAVRYPTVLTWIKGGELPAHRVGRRFRISQRDLDAYLEAGRTVPREKTKTTTRR